MAAFIDKVKAIEAGIGDRAFLPHFLASYLRPYSLQKTTMGTVISQASLQRLEAIVPRTKGKVLIGGKRMAGTSALDGFNLSAGPFYAPTVIEDIEVEDELWKEEVFGPILAVTKFQNEGQAISLANNCKYGLGAGLWTRDVRPFGCFDRKRTQHADLLYLYFPTVSKDQRLLYDSRLDHTS